MGRKGAQRKDLGRGIFVISYCKELIALVLCHDLILG